MFGRQIDVVLIKQNGEALILVNHNDFPNTFNCTGHIDKYSSTECDKLELSIYNLPATIRGDIALGSYSTIVVKYGYKDEGETLGDLFIGNIQRMIYKKPDAVTNETKLWVYDTGEFKSTAFFSSSYNRGMNYYQMAEEIGKQALESGDVAAIQLSEKLKDYATYSGKSFFGSPDDCLEEIAEDTSMVYKKSNNSLLILSPEEIVNQTDAIVFSVFDKSTNKVESASGMIGIPQLTDTGLELECLVNSKINVFSLLKIDNSTISISQEGAIPQAEFGAILDPDGIYVITSISLDFNNTGAECSENITAIARSAFVDMYNKEDEEQDE